MPERRHIEEFARGPFRPHGRIELWNEGGVVHIEAEGPFNVEAVKAMGLAHAALFAQQPIMGLFGDIVHIHRSMMCSHDVIDAFRAFLRANTEHRRAPVAVAWVIAAGVEGRNIMVPAFARVYAECGRLFTAVETVAEAEAWLRDRLREAAAAQQGGAAA